MAKTKAKTKYVCQNCGYVSASWLGKCPECGTWNSLVEEVETQTKEKGFVSFIENSKPRTIRSVSARPVERLVTGIGEFDRVLGGGIVPGSLVLLSGDPGIGKSTILLDTAMRFSQKGVKILYVSGEESEEQTAMRAKRLGHCTDSLLIMTASEIGGILLQAEHEKPDLLVIDSIQTMYCSEIETAAGSVGQVRECAARLLKYAKTTGTAVLVIGHVTKDGTIAGPRILEHMVDTVLQFEGDKSYSFRILRALKNRFGSTDECGIFTMERGGLQEVPNPAGLFLEEREEPVSGAVIGGCLEGNRPLMVEFQALAARTPYGLPRRTATGFDYNRVNMLIAILERRLGMDFGTYDAYVNVVGGMRVTEPAADLPVLAALVSSYRNRAVPVGTLTFGEVGLTGEVRRVPAMERRILDASKLGFRRFVVPRGRLQLPANFPGTVVQVRTAEEALRAIFQEF
ncbi:MAG: DNA repair protein RadA [Succiniclasticum sp.]|jgi:DNA repair protein RadA/Sms